MQMRPLTRVLTVVLTVVLATLGLVVSGCGGDGDHDPDKPTPTQAAPGSAQLRQFFQELATDDIGRMREAQALTEPGSTAGRYVTFQIALGRARLDERLRPLRAVPRKTARGYDLCNGVGKDCFSFTDIRMAQGKVTSFAVDGDEVSDNLSLGPEEPVDFRADGAEQPAGTTRFVSAYLQPSTGSYFVLIDIHAGAAPVRLNLGKARYARVGGEVLEPVARSRTRQVAAGTDFMAVLVFDDALPAGSVDLHLGTTHGPVQVSVSTAPNVPVT